MKFFELSNGVISQVDTISDDGGKYYIYNQWMISSIDGTPITRYVFDTIVSKIYDNIIDWNLNIPLGNCKKCLGSWYCKDTFCDCEFYEMKLELADKFINKDIPKEDKLKMYRLMELF